MYQFEITDFVLDPLTVLFPNLVTLKFEHCFFNDEQQQNFLTIYSFNRLQTLHLHCAFVGHSVETSIRMFDLNQTFPELTEVSFCNVHVVDMPQFFNLNPQITTYEESDCSERIMGHVIANLPNIQTLKLTFEEPILHFGQLNNLQNLHSLSISAIHRDAFIPNPIVSTSLQHLRFTQFQMSHNFTDITQLLQLKSLHLNQCSLSVDYFVEICKKCVHLTEISVVESCNTFPTNNELHEIIGQARHLEMLTITEFYDMRIFPNALFMLLAHTVRERNKKLFVTLRNLHHITVPHTLDDTNIEFSFETTPIDDDDDI